MVLTRHMLRKSIPNSLFKDGVPDREFSLPLHLFFHVLSFQGHVVYSYLSTDSTRVWRTFDS
jgi:hypothetical protein